MRGDDLARDVEPETDALSLGAGHAEELLEDALLVLGRNSRTLVLDLEPDQSLLRPRAHHDPAPLWAVPDRVSHQVVEDEVDAVRVDEHRQPRLDAGPMLSAKSSVARHPPRRRRALA